MLPVISKLFMNVVNADQLLLIIRAIALLDTLCFFPAFGAIYRYGVHRTLGSWRKKYSSQNMTYYFLSFHSSVIFYCFSCRNRRLKVNLRYYSIDLLFKLSKSDSANLDKLFCCALLA